jgi:integrase-like protein
VFPSETKKTKLDPKNFVRRVFLPALKEAQIEGLRWHDLRHTFASRLVMRGVDLRTVQELMGHQSIDMTLRYSHLSPSHQLEAVQRLDEKPSDTRTDTKPQEKTVVVTKRRPKTAKAPDLSEASEKAGDRGRTGDVQLGKRKRGSHVSSRKR